MMALTIQNRILIPLINYSPATDPGAEAIAGFLGVSYRLLPFDADPAYPFNRELELEDQLPGGLELYALPGWISYEDYNE